MDHQHIKAQLQQLLKSGHSIDDIRGIIQAPGVALEQAIQDHVSAAQAARRTLHMQRRQAEYAMHLHAKD